MLALVEEVHRRDVSLRCFQHPLAPIPIGEAIEQISATPIWHRLTIILVSS